MRLGSDVRRLAAVTFVTVLLGTLACAAPAPSPTLAPSPTRPPDPLGARIKVPSFGPDVVAATQEALAREGVATITANSVGQGAPGGPLTALTGEASPLVLIDEQVRAIALDAWSGAGIQGSALDAQVSVPQGSPPPSIVLAAYVDLGYDPDATPGERLAASLVGEVDGEQAVDTKYPLIVQSLLVADMTREGGADRSGRIVLAAFSPCTAVTNFIDNALNTVFDAVKSKSSSELAKLWNKIVSIAHDVVAGLVAALTAPVTETITKIIGFVAVAVEVVSFLRPWTLSVAPDDVNTRFSVGNESSITEAVRLSVDLGGLDEWPTLLAECARAADVTLPNLKPDGAPVNWTFTQFPDPLFPVLPLVTVNPASTLNDLLGVNAATTLRLDTGHEDIQTADGDRHVGLVRVFATVHRPQLQTFKESVIGLVVNGLPAIARDAVASIISGPIEGISAQIDALTNEFGGTDFSVLYHEPKETPKPSQPTATPGQTGRPSSKPGGGTVQTPKPHPSPQPKGGANPCADGCGESVGDPHLQTLDGQEYDFQAAGEFTLLRSPDGSMEMQARQVPYPNIADVSINTALAWLVAGHRVALYANEDGYSLTVDHAPVEADTGTMDLGSGAAVTAMAEGVEVAFPTARSAPPSHTAAVSWARWTSRLRHRQRSATRRRVCWRTWLTAPSCRQCPMALLYRWRRIARSATTSAMRSWHRPGT